MALPAHTPSLHLFAPCDNILTGTRLEGCRAPRPPTPQPSPHGAAGPTTGRPHPTPRTPFPTPRTPRRAASFPFLHCCWRHDCLVLTATTDCRPAVTQFIAATYLRAAPLGHLRSLPFPTHSSTLPPPPTYHALFAQAHATVLGSAVDGFGITTIIKFPTSTV